MHWSWDVQGLQNLEALILSADQVFFAFELDLQLEWGYPPVSHIGRSERRGHLLQFFFLFESLCSEVREHIDFLITVG